MRVFGPYDWSRVLEQNPGATTLMNRFACLAVGLVALGTSFGTFEQAAVAQPTSTPPSNGSTSGAPAASAVPAAPMPVASSVRSSDKPEEARAQIDAYIAGHLARLLSGDARAVRDSREALVGEVLPPPPTVTSAYKDVYAESLAKAVAGHLKEANPQTRLQIAIIVGRAAQSVDNDKLKGAVEALIADPNLGVELWGLKAARGIIAQQVLTPAVLQNSTTLTAVVNAAMKNPADGNIAREAYEALQISRADQVVKLKGAIPVLAPRVLDLLDARSALYAKGIPEQADADREAGTFFALHAFPGLTQEQKVKVVQDLCDQLLLTAQYSVNTPSGPQQKAITDLTRSAGGSLNLIASSIDQAGSTAQTAAFVTATNFFKNMGQIPPPAATILTNAQAVVTAVKAIPAYASITVAQAAAPATTKP